MRSTIAALVFFGALATVPAMAQSNDPQKRNEWALSMSRCLNGDQSMQVVDMGKMETRIETQPLERMAQMCKTFADKEILDVHANRFRAFLASKEPIDTPSDEALAYRAGTEDFDLNMMAGQILSLEQHIRFAAYEECLVDPAGLSKSDCQRITGMDRVRELANRNVVDDEISSEENN